MILHLYGGRNYNATHPESVENLLRLVEGKRPRITWRERLNILRCKLFGHDLVLDRWANARNPQWFRQQDYEIHIGCRRCRFIQVLPPEYDDVHGALR